MNRPSPQTLRRNAVRLAVMVGLMVVAGVAISSRFRIAVDPMKNRCLPYHVYLLDRADQVPARNAYFAFRTQGVRPFEDGTPFIKQMAGMPGDVVIVDGRTIRVAGKAWGMLNPTVLDRAHLLPASVMRHSAIEAGHYLMLGSLPETYDGRYWGDIAATQLIARVYPLW